MSMVVDNILKLKRIIDPTLRPFRVKNDLSANASTGLNEAFDECRQIGAGSCAVKLPPGRYRCDDSLNQAYAGLIAEPNYSRETPLASKGGAMLYHNGSDPLFSNLGGSWWQYGVILFDPNQPGTGVSPVVRPPMIYTPPPYRMIDCGIERTVFMNPYEWIHIPAGSLGGNIHISHNQGFAVRRYILLKEACPESIYLDNNHFTSGVFYEWTQLVNSAMLAKYSSANASNIEIDTSLASFGSTIDGLKSLNNLFYGAQAWVRIYAGGINVSSSTADTFDGADTVIGLTGSSFINSLQMSNPGIWSARPYEPGYKTRAFQLTTSGLVRVTLSGGRWENCNGDWFVDDGSGDTEFEADSWVGTFGTASGNLLDSYVYRIANDNGRYTIRHVAINNKYNGAPAYANSVGISLVKAKRVKVHGVPFRYMKTPISIESTLSVGQKIIMADCESEGTTGAKSVVVTGSPAGSMVAHDNDWDKLTDVANT